MALRYRRQQYYELPVTSVTVASQGCNAWYRCEHERHGPPRTSHHPEQSYDVPLAATATAHKGDSVAWVCTVDSISSSCST